MRIARAHALLGRDAAPFTLLLRGELRPPREAYRDHLADHLGGLSLTDHPIILAAKAHAKREKTV